MKDTKCLSVDDLYEVQNMIKLYSDICGTTRSG